MKEIKNTIELVQYVTYKYENEDEKCFHIKDMEKKGYEVLENFENEVQVVYRKFLIE